MSKPASRPEGDIRVTDAAADDFAPEYADFALEVRRLVPDEVRERARLHILDVVGVALAAARFDFADSAVAAVAAFADRGEVPAPAS